MNWLDITILVLLGLSLFKGLAEGAIRQLTSLAALLIGIYFCGRVAAALRQHAGNWGMGAETTLIFSYVLGFLLVAALVLAVGWLVGKLVGATPLGLFNHIAGGAAGVVLMALFVSLAFNLMDMTSATAKLISSETKVESRFYSPVKKLLPTIFPHYFSLSPPSSLPPDPSPEERNA
jgi:membrane protein required for colicin V production